MAKKVLTLCMIIQDGRVLLGMKKRGFGAGRWNGFGGKVQDGESVQDAAKREVLEETGIIPLEFKERGFIEFDFEDGTKSVEVHIFEVTKFEGEPIETEEMKPEWFDLDKIPLDQMWAADREWLPLFFEGKNFKGRFLYDRPSSPEYAGRIVEKELSEASDGFD